MHVIVQNRHPFHQKVMAKSLCLSNASGNGRASERIRSTDSLNFAGCAAQAEYLFHPL